MKFAERVNKLDRDLLVSGQLFFRYQESTIKIDISQRKIFSVVGILAVPDECFIKPEHQYMVAGIDADFLTV